MSAWLPVVQNGTLTWFDATGEHSVSIGEAGWWAWLVRPDNESFRFEQDLGSFTARREPQRNGAYWYAYRKSNGRLLKTYLGRSTDLTGLRLERAAGRLAELGARVVAEWRAERMGAGRIHPGPDGRVHNSQIGRLPDEATSFIGRQHEMAIVLNLLRSTRLLTLTGEGGIGKTRLALRVASCAAPLYPDGVWVAQLAALDNPERVASTIAAVLGIRERLHEPVLTTVANALGGQRLLLVLDNCEHVAAAAAEVAAVLHASCPGLSILATSRVVLGCAAECTSRVPMLSLPLDPNSVSLFEATRSEAVQLFVARARRVLPEFELSEHTAKLVAHICAHLDGIPLAVELAAAALRVMDLGSLLERLRASLQLPPALRPSAVPHQRTMEATLEWSYALLGPAERILFDRLSVFAGGFSPDAAEAICSAPPLSRHSVLELLTALLDQSLVTPERGRDGTLRHRLLEPVRQFAARRLQVRGESDDLARRQASYLLGFAARAANGLLGPEQGTWLRRFEQELGNIRVVLNWAMANDPAQGLELVGTLWRFWDGRPHVAEGRAWAEQLLASSDSIRPPSKARGMRAVAYLARIQGDLATASAAGEAFLAAARQIGRPADQAWALYGLARTAFARGTYSQSAALVAEALPLFERTNDEHGQGWSKVALGQIEHHQGNLLRARAYFEQADVLFRRLGYPEGIGDVLYSLGLVDLDEGDLDHARARLAAYLDLATELGYELKVGEARNRLGELNRRAGDLAAARAEYEQSIGLARKSGDTTGLASAFAGLARVLVELGDPVAIWPVLDEALRLARAVGNTRFEARCLTSRAELERARGHPARARCWHLESMRLRFGRGDRIGLVENLIFLAALALDDNDVALATHLLALTETLLGQIGLQVSGSEGAVYRRVEAAVTRARITGRRRELAGRSLDELLEELLAAEGVRPPASVHAPQHERETLTPRERQVLILVACGESNRDIANRLVLSVRTVERHTASIYSKLGASGRAGRALATAYALTHGLGDSAASLSAQPA